MNLYSTKKASIISITVVILITLLLTACGGADPEATKAPSKDPITLTYSSGFTGPDRPAYEELAKQFTAKYPHITINMDIQPWDVLLAKLATSLATGQGPDIASFDTALLPQYAKANLVLPLDELYTAGMDQSVMAPSLISAMKYEGKFYAVPANTATLLMYYNKDIFKAAGIAAPPTTWAEWHEAILKTTKTDGEKQYGLVLADHATIPMWPILIWGNGGDITNADNTKSMLSDPKTIEAFKIWGDLVASKGISPAGLTGADADKLFGAGKAAMEINGPWMAGGLGELNYGVAPVPAGPAGKFTLANAVAMVAGKNTKHKEAVFEFMKFWNSAESQAYLSSKSGFPPTRTDLGDNELVKSNPLIPQFAAVAKDAKFYLPGLDQFAKIDGDIITPAIQAITNKSGGTVEDVLADASKKLDAILSAK